MGYTTREIESVSDLVDLQLLRVLEELNFLILQPENKNHPLSELYIQRNAAVIQIIIAQMDYHKELRNFEASYAPQKENFSSIDRYNVAQARCVDTLDTQVKLLLQDLEKAVQTPGIKIDEAEEKIVALAKQGK